MAKYTIPLFDKFFIAPSAEIFIVTASSLNR